MKVGFVVNPIAGMGGSVALKGTDGEDTLRRALDLGAVPNSDMRANEAVKIFSEVAAGHQFLTVSGSMGESLLTKYGLSVSVIWETGGRTTQADTKEAVSIMLKEGVELLIFAGGDGTARDICSVVACSVPVIGIPAGVKVHSAVYANKPENAGMLAKNVLSGETKKYIEAEVMDIDEDLFRENIVRAKLYGYMRVPDDRKFMQNRKTSGAGKESYETDATAAWTIDQMRPGAVYLIGSGSTTAKIMTRMGLESTLLGVDAVGDGQLLAADVNEKEIIEILEQYDKSDRYLVVTLIGGQGHIFGRGNQQLSPRVLRMLRKENIIIIAAPSKMAQLFGRPLISDTGDAELDSLYSGYMAVAVGYDRKLMARVV